jgi:hypothetical protein
MYMSLHCRLRFPVHMGKGELQLEDGAVIYCVHFNCKRSTSFLRTLRPSEVRPASSRARQTEKVSVREGRNLCRQFSILPWPELGLCTDSVSPKSLPLRGELLQSSFEDVLRDHLGTKKAKNTIVVKQPNPTQRH